MLSIVSNCLCCSFGTINFIVWRVRPEWRLCCIKRPTLTESPLKRAAGCYDLCGASSSLQGSNYCKLTGSRKTFCPLCNTKHTDLDNTRGVLHLTTQAGFMWVLILQLLRVLLTANKHLTMSSSSKVKSIYKLRTRLPSSAISKPSLDI